MGFIMTVAKSILTISRDQSLQSTRTLILQQGGYIVFAALNDNDAIGFLGGSIPLDLVLMCHSVPEASRIYLATEIKRLKPRLPILMLYNGYDPTSANVDGSLHSLETPEALLDMIGFMTSNIGSTVPQKEPTDQQARKVPLTHTSDLRRLRRRASD